MLLYLYKRDDLSRAKSVGEISIKMKNAKFQIVAIFVFVLIICAGKTTLGDSECCIDCRKICCRGGCPSLPCFVICAQKCPDYATCGADDCIKTNNIIGK